jgi:hypothetical protein
VDELGYKAGLTTDLLIKTVIDATSGSTSVTALATYFRNADVANGRHVLQGADVKPMSSGPANGFFYMIMHPYISYDFLNDPSTGGFRDMVKFTDPSPLINIKDRSWLGTSSQTKIYEATTPTKTTGSPNKWRTYMFGDHGLGAVSLSGKGPSKVMDPEKQRFNIKVIHDDGNNIANPTGIIRATAGYNFKFVAVVLDTTTYRFRMWDTPSSIVA